MKLKEAITIEFVSGVWVDPDDPIEARRRAFAWAIKDISDTGIEIDISFMEPLYISVGEAPDTLIATFIKNYLYLDPEDPTKEILPSGYSTPITLPPQMPKVSSVANEVKPEAEL